MATPLILGSSNAIEQPQTVGYSPSRGWYTVRTWKGKKNAIDTLSNSLVSAGYEFQIDHGPGGISTVRAQTPQNLSSAEEAVNLWEIQPIAFTKDILEADIAAIESISEDDKIAIRHAIQSPPDPPTSPALTDPNAIDTYLLMLSGVREIKKFSITLRHTQTVSNQWAVPISLTNVNRLHSTATLISDEAPPGWIASTMPTFVSNRAGLVYGWYKSLPTITIVSYQRTQLVQEWEFGLWATFLYGALL